MSVKVLKHDCGIRDHNFSSVFRREVGITIKHYIECLRVQAACDLLDMGTMTAADVGYAVGYEHLQTFYRVFKRRLLCTPGQYLAGIGEKKMPVGSK
jgi:two-component system response regulator YesN